MTAGRMRLDWRPLTVGALVLGSMFCQMLKREPGVPSTPAGPSSGIIGPRYTFQSVADDPDSDKLSYRFDWGDGDTSDWIGAPWQQAGDATHDWSAPGTYTLRAQAKNDAGLVSGWSDGHQFSVASISAWTFGGEFGDGAGSVLQTSDGGYIIAGYTGDTGAGDADAWLIRTDAAGNTVWARTFGGVNGDGGSDAQQTSDGGYIITGYTDATGDPGCNAWLVKTDESGNKVWDKTFGGAGLEGGNSVQQTTDGGYIVVGYTCASASDAADVWLIKTDASGEEVWDKTLGGTAEDHGYSVLQAADGGYIITGFTCSFGAGEKDVWLIKTDASGNKVWDRTFGGANWDEGHSVWQTADGGYVITGFTRSFGAGEEDVWLIKTDASGNKVWDRTFGGSSTDEGNSVQQTADGGYVIAGRTYSYGSVESDVWLIKTDANGQ